MPKFIYSASLKGHKRSLVSNFSYICYGSAVSLYNCTSGVLMNFGRYKKKSCCTRFSVQPRGKLFFVRTNNKRITVVIWHALTLVLCHSADNDI